MALGPATFQVCKMNERSSLVYPLARVAIQQIAYHTYLHSAPHYQIIYMCLVKQLEVHVRVLGGNYDKSWSNEIPTKRYNNVVDTSPLYILLIPSPTHLVSSCIWVLTTQIGLVIVVVAKPGRGEWYFMVCCVMGVSGGGGEYLPILQTPSAPKDSRKRELGYKPALPVNMP